MVHSPKQFTGYKKDQTGSLMIVIRTIINAVIQPSDLINSQSHELAICYAYEYVQRRLIELPILTRTSFSILLVLFTMSARLKLGKPFANATLSDQRNMISVAEQTCLVPFDNMMKFIRSFAYLGYYGHAKHKF